MQKSKSVLITLKIPEELAEAIDKLVDNNIFESRSEAIRYAIGNLLTNPPKKQVRELWKKE